MGFASGFNHAIKTLFDTPLWMYALLLTLGIAGGFALWRIIHKDEVELEQLEIEDIVYQNIYELVETLGDGSRKNLRHGYKDLGSILHYFTRTVQVPVETDDDGKVKEWEEDEQDVFLCEHKGFINDIRKMLGFTPSHEIYVVPNDVISISDAVEIRDDVEFEKFGGVFFTRNSKAMEVAKEMMMKETAEELMKSIPNYARKQNWMDSFFAKDIQGKEESARIEKEKYRDYAADEAEEV